MKSLVKMREKKRREEGLEVKEKVMKNKFECASMYLFTLLPNCRRYRKHKDGLVYARDYLHNIYSLTCPILLSFFCSLQNPRYPALHGHAFAEESSLPHLPGNRCSLV